MRRLSRLPSSSPTSSPWSSWSASPEPSAWGGLAGAPGGGAGRLSATPDRPSGGPSGASQRPLNPVTATIERVRDFFAEQRDRVDTVRARTGATRASCPSGLDLSGREPRLRRHRDPLAVAPGGSSGARWSRVVFAWSEVQPGGRGTGGRTTTCATTSSGVSGTTGSRWSDCCRPPPAWAPLAPGRGPGRPGWPASPGGRPAEPVGRLRAQDGHRVPRPDRHLGDLERAGHPAGRHERAVLQLGRRRAGLRPLLTVASRRRSRATPGRGSSSAPPPTGATRTPGAPSSSNAP